MKYIESIVMEYIENILIKHNLPPQLYGDRHFLQLVFEFCLHSTLIFGFSMLSVDSFKLAAKPQIFIFSSFNFKVKLSINE